MKPIFLFSLPRSGSTLLQRILLKHGDLTSVSEPWILLPYLSVLKEDGILTDYSQFSSAKAIDEFIATLPNKKNDYVSSLRHFIVDLYSMHCKNDESFFLDKTPRYHLIIPEIFELFPHAKFVFLIRNPVQIISSMIETWGNGSLEKLYSVDLDLRYGFRNLAKGVQQIGDKAYILNFDDLLLNPELKVKEICEYLGITYESFLIKEFSSDDLEGIMGDKTGRSQYQEINKKPLYKWKSTVSNKFRANIIKKYIENVDEISWEILGYDKQELLNPLENIPSTINLEMISDIFQYYKSVLIRKYNLNIYLGQRTKNRVGDKFLS